MEWVLLPAVGALIGWLTNRMAIRLLFRPHHPIQLLGISLQGLLPRRRGDLAETVGGVVEQELLSRETLATQLLQPGVQRDIISAIVQAATTATRDRLPSLVPTTVANLIVSYAREAAHQEARRFVVDELPRLVQGFADQIRVADLVRRRINELDLGELEDLVLAVARRELRHIELLGALLGFGIGLAQAAILQLLN